MGTGHESSKAPGDSGHCSKSARPGHISSEAPLAGSLCSFEHPREPGLAELGWLARRQEWCLHRHQLQAAGLSRKAVRARVASGLLHPILSDVFLWGRATPTPLSMSMAILLHLRGDAVLGWDSAAWLHGLADECPDTISVVLARRSARMKDVRIHRLPALDDRDVRWRRGLPATAPGRTLIDYAAVATALEVESALARFRLQGTDREVADALSRVPGNHPGAPIIRALLELPPGTISLTRSRYERRLREMVAAAALPMPTSNHGVEGVESDLVWVEQKLIIEFDGWETHRSKVHADKARDAKLIAAGWRVLRLTADRVDNEPLLVIAQITQALLG